MSENSPRHHIEGPARKLNDAPRDLTEINEPLPNGQSYADHLDALYGKGNWSFEPISEDKDSPESAERAKHRLEFDLATQAFKNVVAGEGYTDTEGKPVSSKVERRTAKPQLGDIVVTPDGDDHAVTVFQVNAAHQPDIFKDRW